MFCFNRDSQKTLKRFCYTAKLAHAMFGKIFNHVGRMVGL